MKGRITKAEKYMQLGDCGLLYCEPVQAFTVPFIVGSKADANRIERGVWPEPWHLPFSICPLGRPDRHLFHEDAKLHWDFLKKRLKASGGVTAALNITGVTVFVPVEIGPEDWAQIIADLGDPPPS